MTANPRNPALSDIGDGAMPEGMEGLLKQLVWEDVDEICTRCVAPVFGGKMIVVEISPGSGEYSAGIDLGGLCFRLIQDAYDDNGFRYSAPKNFGSIDAAKAAAQADYTARVLSAVDPDEITRLRAALAEKIVVKVKPLEFNQRASSWWAMSPFGFYVVAPTKTDNGDQWGIWYPETDIEDDPDGYASNEGAAMAVSQHAYERRVLSAVEAVPASQIRAEALREALAAAIRVIKYGKQSRRDSIVFDVEEAILALIDAPKVTT